METILKLFAFDEWANARILAALKSAATRNEKAQTLLAHVLISEKIWLLRLKGEDTSKVDKSPELSIDECESLAREVRRAYVDYLSSLSESDLDSKLTYRNFAGAEYHTPVRDILLHVAQHGTYHRGQIATAVRGAGATPVNTDFITFVREVSAQQQ
ncbi:MAG TPA: DinB family protein [Pyrinomonadaceae bacterium]|jgi:uncharacterized damage-inducible protein DinB